MVFKLAALLKLNKKHTEFFQCLVQFNQAAIHTVSSFHYSGFWRFGYDTMEDWENSPLGPHFKGVLDEIRVMDRYCSDAFIHFSYENQKPASSRVSILK